MKEGGNSLEDEVAVSTIPPSEEEKYRTPIHSNEREEECATSQQYDDTPPNFGVHTRYFKQKIPEEPERITTSLEMIVKEEIAFFECLRDRFPRIREEIDALIERLRRRLGQQQLGVRTPVRRFAQSFKGMGVPTTSPASVSTAATTPASATYSLRRKRPLFEFFKSSASTIPPESSPLPFPVEQKKFRSSIIESSHGSPPVIEPTNEAPSHDTNESTGVRRAFSFFGPPKENYDSTSLFLPRRFWKDLVCSKQQSNIAAEHYSNNETSISGSPEDSDSEESRGASDSSGSEHRGHRRDADHHHEQQQQQQQHHEHQQQQQHHHEHQQQQHHHEQQQQHHHEQQQQHHH
eukprot:Lankesteria_metandrocarpae@DN3610_c0_g1_i1.p1